MTKIDFFAFCLIWAIFGQKIFFFQKKKKSKNFFLRKKIQNHLLVIGWSYRPQNISKGFREQVETVFYQFRKKNFSEFFIENLAFFSIAQNGQLWSFFAHRSFFFQKLEQMSEILVAVVSFCDLSLFFIFILKKEIFFSNALL